MPIDAYLFTLAALITALAYIGDRAHARAVQAQARIARRLAEIGSARNV